MPEKTRSRVPQMKRHSPGDSLTTKGAPTGAIPMKPASDKTAKPSSARTTKAKVTKSRRSEAAKSRPRRSEATSPRGGSEARAASDARTLSPLREFLESPAVPALVSAGVEMVMAALIQKREAAREERRAMFDREDARERRLHELVAMMALRAACPVPPAPPVASPADPSPAKE